MCECCCNGVGFCCGCFYDLGRSIPVISILSFILFFIGFSLALHGRGITSQPLQTMGVTDLTAFLEDLEVAFFFAFVFNGLAVFASFLASGKTREVLFQKTDYCCTSCFQFLLGRCTLGIIFSCCLLILLVDVVLLGFVASTSSLVLEVLGACSTIGSLGAPVSTTLQLVTGVKLPLEQFDAICRSGLGSGFSTLIAGTILLVVGQVLLITALSSNYTTILLEPYLLPREKWSPDYGAASDVAA
mmetsp:Transcript_85052/g.104286  ORF Transcript_85052/g.104286 Transcript_85052/m.104286 type:complete len:244 (+) Transcript_85052:56-787(+)